MFLVFPRFASGRFARRMGGVGGGGPRGQLEALCAGTWCSTRLVLDHAYGRGGRVHWGILP